MASSCALFTPDPGGHLLSARADVGCGWWAAFGRLPGLWKAVAAGQTGAAVGVRELACCVKGDDAGTGARVGRGAEVWVCARAAVEGSARRKHGARPEVERRATRAATGWGGRHLLTRTPAATGGLVEGVSRVESDGDGDDWPWRCSAGHLAVARVEGRGFVVQDRRVVERAHLPR